MHINNKYPIQLLTHKILLSTQTWGKKKNQENERGNNHIHSRTADEYPFGSLVILFHFLRFESFRAHKHRIDHMHDQSNVGELYTSGGWKVAMVIQYLINLLEDGAYMHYNQRVGWIYSGQNLPHPC